MNNLTQLYGFVSLVVIAVSLQVRMASGASVRELVTSRFYEIPALRTVIVSIGLSFWAAVVYAGCICVEQTWSWYDLAPPGSGQAACVAALICGVFLGIAIFYWSFAVHVGAYRPTPDILDADIQHGIEEGEIACLGHEQFPEKIRFGDDSCVTARKRLVSLGILLLVLAGASFTDWGYRYGLEAARLQTEHWLRNLIPELPDVATAFLITTLLLAAGMLLLFNRTYTVLRFPTTVLLAASLSIGLTVSCVAAGVSVEILRWAIVGSVAAWTVRWGEDLSRASDFQRTTSLLRPVRENICSAVPFLRALSTYPDCRISVPEPAAIRLRVADGCRNVEEADPLVTPFLARFLSEVRANYQQMNAAMLRFLTVRRGVDVSGETGTTRWLQHPVVPMWDEQQFPLRPPRGFTNYRDPLKLGSEWDIVKTCWSCGGSGHVNCSSCSGRGQRLEPEIYTVYSGGQSEQRTRYVERTCTMCSGSGQCNCNGCGAHGRVAQTQTLVTTWERYLPTETAPYTEMSHLLEDAEERVFFRRPLVEDRQPIDVSDETDDLHPDTVSAMTAAADQVQSTLPTHIERVQSLRGGRVYRADFQITAFHVIRIGFRGLQGGHGWFFGKRPEFYFPSLPLSWGKIAAVVFVWPFVLLTAWQLGTTIRESVLAALGP